MMEESKLERCLILVFLLCLLAQSNYAQKDFVSIACCATSNYTDPSTEIDWITDFSWFPDKSNCRKATQKPPSDANHNEARVFFGVEHSSKRCYRLETVKGQEYLMRGTFLYYGDSASPTIRTSFSILIGVTSIGEVTSLDDYLEIEGIFKAKGDNVEFCLERRERAPYMSRLVLRPLKGLEYLGESSSSVLRVIKRVNLGASEGDFVKYPDDPSDRIWEPDPTKSNTTKVNDAQVLNYQSKPRAPLQVLRTAVEDPTLLLFSYKEEPSDASNSSHYRVILYFLELRSAVEPGQRLFDIVVNGETRHAGFDVSGGGSNYKEVAWEVNANGVVEVSLVRASGSVWGPICNAYEIFQRVSWVEETKVNDVSAIMELKRELLEFNRNNKVVQSWSGDPCLPQPWEGLFCDSINNLTLITKLSLSSMDLSGPIPPSITNLTNLNTLNLSLNKLTGQIPGFPSTSMLRLIDLRNNDLEGPLPEDLPMLAHLETLYIGCNPIVKEEDQSRVNTSKLDTSSESCTESRTASSKRYIIIASLACGSLILAGIVIFCFYKRKLMPQSMFKDKGHKRHKETKKNTGPLIIKLPIMHEIVVKSIKIQTFTLAQIEAATESYKTLIGEGGFGSVYRGKLCDGQEVAVKVRSATSTQGTREFQNELNLLSTIFHENLVPLLGFCSENDQEILVYPFMSNGSLQDRLCGDASRRKKLDWPTRLSIALGAARGLAHLHMYCGRGIIHRDVKSSNILLDHSMNAKVADFGFSKYAPQEGDSCASLEVRGTAGYLDPEYYTTHHLSDKSDVFSFGVVLLEIISGREPLNVRRERSEWSLVEWAKQQVRESNIDEIVDPSIKGGYHSEAMWRVVEVSLLCVEPYSAYRPCMTDVMRELEDALIIENNASEYMRSIESSGSVVLDKKLGLVLTPTEASPLPTLDLPPPEPR